MKIYAIRYYAGGNLIFQEPMVFKRLYAVGQDVVLNSKNYKVTSVQVQNGIEHVYLTQINYEEQ
jgi:hypothetical protein